MCMESYCLLEILKYLTFKQLSSAVIFFWDEKIVVMISSKRITRFLKQNSMDLVEFATYKFFVSELLSLLPGFSLLYGIL